MNVLLYMCFSLSHGYVLVKIGWWWFGKIVSSENARLITLTDATQERGHLNLTKGIIMAAYMYLGTQHFPIPACLISEPRLTH